MLAIQLACIAACGGCFSYGGYKDHNFRRFVMPLLLWATLAWLCHDWRLLMAVIPTAGALVMGYGEKSVFRHVFGDGWGRGVWGLLVAISLCVPLVLTHHLSIWLALPYLALSFILENALKRVNQIIGDLIIGAAFGSIVLLVHP